MNRFVIALLALVALAVPTSAQLLTVGLYNTGVDVSGGVDQRYGITASPGGAYTVAYDQTTTPGLWLANSTGSHWIGPAANGDGTTAMPVGDYTYQLTFDLSGYDVDNLSILGQWATDNQGAELRLNGVVTEFSIPYSEMPDPWTSEYSFQEWHAFNLLGGFVAGVNTLEFVVHNEHVSSPGDLTPNPTGLRVEYTAMIPEPSTYAALCGLATLVVVGIRRFRRRLA